MIDLSKQQAFNADSKIKFTGNLETQSAIFFIIEETKKQFSIFYKELEKHSNFIFALNIKWLNIILLM